MLAPCPYLDHHNEQKIFTEINPDITPEEFHLLTASGFRRNNNILYKQSCPNCQKCVSVRIPVASFRPNKSERRVLKKNDMIEISDNTSIHKEEYQLFIRYQKNRHQESEMLSMQFEDYKTMINTNTVQSNQLKIKQNDKTIGIMLYDETLDAYSAVYSFYDPDLEKQSLGKFLILKLIEKAQENNKRFIYLGYWIKECQKMSYKSLFSPLEKLTQSGWEPF